MGKTYRKNDQTQDEDYYVRSKRRAEPDLRRLARALISIAEAQAEAEAEAAHLSGKLAPPRTLKKHQTAGATSTGRPATDTTIGSTA